MPSLAEHVWSWCREDVSRCEKTVFVTVVIGMLSCMVIGGCAYAMARRCIVNTCGDGRRKRRLRRAEQTIGSHTISGQVYRLSDSSLVDDVDVHSDREEPPTELSPIKKTPPAKDGGGNEA